MSTSASTSAAAAAIASADALLIGAGAGMGVDSGLPDFRGPEGFWRAYPPFRKLGLRFTDLANPEWFDRDPPLAWGFYGHRLHLYRETVPHEGFGILRALVASRPAFVFTSNVDGAFQRAGFPAETVYEVHGSIHHLQCSRSCSDAIWPAEETAVDLDENSFRARGELPACPRCGAVARPNVLMFGDWGWTPSRSDAQQGRYSRFLRDVVEGGLRLAVIEIGAGTAVPTVRHQCERVAARLGTLIRINPREDHGPVGTIGLPTGGLEGLRAIVRATDPAAGD